MSSQHDVFSSGDLQRSIFRSRWSDGRGQQREASASRQSNCSRRRFFLEIRLGHGVVVLLPEPGAPFGFGFSVALAKCVPHLQNCVDILGWKAALLVKPLAPQFGDDGHETNPLVMAVVTLRR